MRKVHARRIKLRSTGHHIESNHEYETNRTTAMLLVVVALFLIHELPHGILALCNIFIPDFYIKVYSPIGDLLDMLALLNNSINFILYCSMSHLFKETFKDIFCGWVSSRRLPPDWLQWQHHGGFKAEVVMTNSEGTNRFLIQNS